MMAIPESNTAYLREGNGRSTGTRFSNPLRPSLSAICCSIPSSARRLTAPFQLSAPCSASTYGHSASFAAAATEVGTPAAFLRNAPHVESAPQSSLSSPRRALAPLSLGELDVRPVSVDLGKRFRLGHLRVRVAICF